MSIRKLASLGLLFAVAVSVLLGAPTARATAPFKKEFDNLYVKKEPGTPEEKSLAEAVATAKCNVCHMGESKKMHNVYGLAVKKLLTKKDIKDIEKIKGALKKVEDEKSDEKNGSSPTFGELLKQGKLPAGDSK